MKKYIVILLTALFVCSCNLDDGTNETSNVVLPIESIQLPSEFVLNEEYDIPFTFVRPTDCHSYENIFVIAENETRTIAVKSVVYINPNCVALTENNIAEQSFKFKVLYDQTYVFRIWKGIDESGGEIYEEVAVPVIN